MNYLECIDVKKNPILIPVDLIESVQSSGENVLIGLTSQNNFIVINSFDSVIKFIKKHGNKIIKVK